MVEYIDIDLPPPIAAYVAVANSGEEETLAHCFLENAVVRDEGQTIEGLAAIKQWMAETRKKYQHTIEPLASAQKDSKTSSPTGLPGIFLAVPSNLSSPSLSTARRSHRWRSSPD